MEAVKNIKSVMDAKNCLTIVMRMYADICVGQRLPQSFDLRGKLIFADKGYDSHKFVHRIASQGGIAIIPSTSTSQAPHGIDWHIYQEHHLIEKPFLKRKNNRCFAAGYEKKLSFLRRSPLRLVFLFGCFDGLQTRSRTKMRYAVV